MPLSETQPGPDSPLEEVLTLAEAAAYLRVPAAAVSEMAANRSIPAQQIGGEWRFLKRALTDWLRFGPRYADEFGRFPLPWFLDHPMWEEFFHRFTTRLLKCLPTPEQPSARPGSKEAVRKHFGVWRDDPTAEGMLADIYQRRAGEGEE